MSFTSSSASPAGSALQAEVQQFYAWQMHLLDSGEADAWAETFTEDGVFAANAHPEPARGRETIRAAAAKAAAQRAEEGIQVRHWLGMLEVRPREDGSVLALSYALIVNTPMGGSPQVHLSTTCEDVLVRGEDGGWLVRDRQVKRDDLP
ncbi:nuclear transport factor 2 family protein [Kitasatospora sp. NPDC057198]|uniref:nuclear transport factor 2 family protein n=1 Tax=Kitasatospora sp. NPDC057198 TaxID=3346046 RepID=UPI00363494F4